MHDRQINAHRRDIEDAGYEWSAGMSRIDSELLEEHRHGRADHDTNHHRDYERTSYDHTQLRSRFVDKQTYDVSEDSAA